MADPVASTVEKQRGVNAGANSLLPFHSVWDPNPYAEGSPKGWVFHLINLEAPSQTHALILESVRLAICLLCRSTTAFSNSTLTTYAYSYSPGHKSKAVKALLPDC